MHVPAGPVCSLIIKDACFSWSVLSYMCYLKMSVLPKEEVKDQLCSMIDELMDGKSAEVC